MRWLETRLKQQNYGQGLGLRVFGANTRTISRQAALNATATASTCDLSSADVEMLQGVLRGMSQHTGDQHCLYNISLDAILAM